MMFQKIIPPKHNLKDLLLNIKVLILYLVPVQKKQTEILIYLKNLEKIKNLQFKMNASKSSHHLKKEKKAKYQYVLPKILGLIQKD